MPRAKRIARQRAKDRQASTRANRRIRVWDRKTHNCRANRRQHRAHNFHPDRRRK